MSNDNPFCSGKKVSAFINPGSLYFHFFLAIDLHLTPAEKIAGTWKLGDRTGSVKQMVLDWYSTTLGGMSGGGSRRLRYLIELIGEDLKNEEPDGDE